MRHRWPDGIVFTHKILVPEDRVCPRCGRHMHICDHRRHPFYTLEGPVELLCKLVHCPDKACQDHSHTHSPLAETGVLVAAGGEAKVASPEQAKRPLDEAGDVVLDYCSAVRGILNDDQGGPEHPPGLRMAAALGEVKESLRRGLEAKKGGVRKSSCGG